MFCFLRSFEYPLKYSSISNCKNRGNIDIWNSFCATISCGMMFYLTLMFFSSELKAWLFIKEAPRVMSWACFRSNSFCPTVFWFLKYSRAFEVITNGVSRSPRWYPTLYPSEFSLFSMPGILKKYSIFLILSLSWLFSYFKNKFSFESLLI